MFIWLNTDEGQDYWRTIDDLFRRELEEFSGEEVFDESVLYRRLDD